MGVSKTTTQETAATLPLSGAELVRIVQNGDNAKSTAADIANTGASVINVLAFGADPTGVADSTAAFNAAIAAAQEQGFEGKPVYGAGTFRIGTLNGVDDSFDDIRIPLYLYGKLILTDTFVQGDNIDVIGLGGSHGSQFQLGPALDVDCSELAPGTTAWKIPGGRTYTANLRIHDVPDRGILCDGDPGGALARFENVACGSGNAQPAFEAQKFFWIFCDRCRFTGNGGGPSVYLNQNGSGPNNTYLTYFNELILNFGGIVCEGVNAAVFRDVASENLLVGVKGFTLIDCSNVVIDGYTEADALGGGSEITGSYNIQLLGDNALKDGFSLDDGRIIGLFTDSGPHSGGAINDGWTMPRTLPGFVGDFILGNLHTIGDALSPSVVPIAPEVLNAGGQDAAGWDAAALSQGNGIVVGYGMRSPDGTFTAAKLSTASGTPNFFYHSGSYTPAVGDYVIFGLWLKKESAAGVRLENRAAGLLWSSANVAFETTDSTISDIGPGNVFGAWNSNNTLGAWEIDGWVPLVGIDKVIVASGGPYTLDFRSQVSATKPLSAWQPFLYYIPASSIGTGPNQVPEDDIKRLYQSLRRGPVTAAVGDIAVLDHQKIKLGGGVRLDSRAAEPTMYLYQVGDRTFDSTAATDGWTCDAAGGAQAGARGDLTPYATGVWAAWPTGTTVWECTESGTTAAAPPSIVGLGVGDTVVDATVTWTMRSLTTATFRSGL